MAKRDLHWKVGARPLKATVGEPIERDVANRNTHCPTCGYGPLDGATGVSFSEEGQQEESPKQIRPEPGTPTICAKCGELLIFDENLKIRSPNQQELETIQSDHQNWYIIQFLQEQIRSRS